MSRKRVYTKRPPEAAAKRKDTDDDDDNADDLNVIPSSLTVGRTGGTSATTANNRLRTTGRGRGSARSTGSRRQGPKENPKENQDTQKSDSESGLSEPTTEMKQWMAKEDATCPLCLKGFDEKNNEAYGKSLQCQYCKVKCHERHRQGHYHSCPKYPIPRDTCILCSGKLTEGEKQGKCRHCSGLCHIDSGPEGNVFDDISSHIDHHEMHCGKFKFLKEASKGVKNCE